MFKKLLKNKRAQQTAEYALLISLVVAAVIAMQTYAQRAIQARIRGAAGYMVNGTSELGNEKQYEPYYTSSSYEVQRDASDTQSQGINQVAYSSSENRIRSNGETSTSYSGFDLINGI